MDRRAFLGTVVGSLLAVPLAAEAQQAAKLPRIGYLALNPAANPHLHEAFRQGMRDLGYVEGRNVLIEYRDAEGKPERLPALAAELVALKVDVLVAQPTVSSLAAKQATGTIPIVFTAASDPVSSGLVTSLARPGGNLTGLSVLAPELVGKGLELIKQTVPGVSRVAVLWDPGAFPESTAKDTQRDQASTPVEHSTVQPGTKGPRRHEPGRPRAFSWSTRTESCAASRPDPE